MPIVYKRGLSVPQLCSLEVQLQVTLPVDYRHFLSQANGLYIAAPDFSQLPLAAVRDGVISFDRLFGVNAGEQCNDLAAFNDEFIGELDFLQSAIAIGEDGGGNPYVLAQDAGRQGVYYWDRTQLHEETAGTGAGIGQEGQTLFRLARDFQAFHALIMDSLDGDPAWLMEN